MIGPTMLLDAGAAADFVEGRCQRIDSVSGPVLVVRHEGQLFAVSDVCPHRGNALSDGVFRAGTITCPAHLWRFDVRDGRQCGHPPGGPRSPSEAPTRIDTFSVTTSDDGRVHVEVPGAQVVPASLSWRERLLASVQDTP